MTPTLQCDGCSRYWSGEGVQKGQRHKGCTASPAGRLMRDVVGYKPVKEDDGLKRKGSKDA